MGRSLSRSVIAYLVTREKRRATSGKILQDIWGDNVVDKRLQNVLSQIRGVLKGGRELIRKPYKGSYGVDDARDYSFEASRNLSALVLAYLARSYAKSGDTYHFEKTIETSLRIAHNLGKNYGNGENFVVHTISDILEEKSNGYIELSDGKQTLAMKDEVENYILLDNNNFLKIWIPLDYAQAYMAIGEVEASMVELRAFYEGVKIIQSPLALSKIYTHIRQLEEKGYGQVKTVRDFKEMLLHHGNRKNNPTG